MNGASFGRALATLLAIIMSTGLVMLLREQAQKSEVFAQLCRDNARTLQAPPKAFPVANPEVALLLLMHCDYSAKQEPRQ